MCHVYEEDFLFKLLQGLPSWRLNAKLRKMKKKIKRPIFVWEDFNLAHFGQYRVLYTDNE
jgi:hypothetical protein